MKTETYKQIMDAIDKYKSRDGKIMITFDNMIAVFIDEFYDNGIICKGFYDGYIVAIFPITKIRHIRLIK